MAAVCAANFVGVVPHDGYSYLSEATEGPDVFISRYISGGLANGSLQLWSLVISPSRCLMSYLS